MFPSWLLGLIAFLILGLLPASQLFWFWLARKLVHGQSRRWLRWLLGIPVYAWFGGLLGVFLLVPVRLFWLRDSPILLSLFWELRRPGLMVPLALWCFASMFSFLLVALVWGGGWAARKASGRMRSGAAGESVAAERRYFLQTATYGAGSLPFVLTAYGFFIGRQEYHVREVSVPIANLPPALDGLRLLQLSDLHASAYMPPREIRRVVGLAREIEADLVFHTGDFLTSAGDPLEAAVEELSRVRSRYGSFGCLGNHEIYALATETATRLFAQRGVHILRREKVELEINGAGVNLIGVDYQRGRRGLSLEEGKKYYLRGVEELVRPDKVNILLSHNPNAFLRAADLGIDLTIAGHTHGGQVQVEILDTRWSPARFVTPFISGLYQRPVPSDPRPVASRAAGETNPSSSAAVAVRRTPGTAFLYVSPGLGTVGAPVRLNVPPEITLLTLRRMG